MPRPTKPLTRDDLEAGYEDAGWNGYGYLNERMLAMRTAAGRALAEQADERVLAYANANHWTASDLFNWSNSKLGRWFGDAYFHGTPATLERDVASTLRKVAP